MNPRKLTAILGAALLAAVPAAVLAGPDDDGGAYLGVSLQSLEGGLAEALDMEENSGVLIGQVMDESPAAKSGLEKGDIVVRVAGKTVGTPSKLQKVVREHDPGDEVEIEVLRDGKTKTVKVALAERADRLPRHHRLREVHDLRLAGNRGYLGVMTQALSGDLAKYFGADDGGALVSEVVEDSPAAELGLQAGDVIVKVGESDVTNPEVLREVIREYEEAEEVEIVWIRDKKEKKGKVTLEVREGTDVLGFLPELEWHGADGSLPDFRHHLDGIRDGIRRHVRLGIDEMGELHREEIEGSLRSTLDELREEMDEMRKELDELKEKKSD